MERFHVPQGKVELFGKYLRKIRKTRKFFNLGNFIHTSCTVQRNRDSFRTKVVRRILRTVNLILCSSYISRSTKVGIFLKIANILVSSLFLRRDQKDSRQSTNVVRIWTSILVLCCPLSTNTSTFLFNCPKLIATDDNDYSFHKNYCQCFTMIHNND